MPIIRSPAERIADHLAVARLEDVQRQKDVGKQDDVGSGKMGRREGSMCSCSDLASS